MKEMGVGVWGRDRMREGGRVKQKRELNLEEEGKTKKSQEQAAIITSDPPCYSIELVY